MPEKELVQTRINVFHHPKDNQLVSIKIPKGLRGEAREEAIKDEMLSAMLNLIHFTFNYV